jgi:aryl-alcohol dehydrogenase-like predicted oxidoreductase
VEPARQHHLIGALGDRFRGVRARGDGDNVTHRSLCLAWEIARKSPEGVIPIPSRPESITNSVQAARLTLTADE